RLLADRGVSPQAPWRDFFDAAEALLDEASIDRALAGLARSALVALAEAGTGAVARASRDELESLALVDAEGRVHRSVAARVRELSAAQPAAFRPVAPVPAPPVATSGEEAA